jgi:UDP-N-acetylglucosamine:LPS N-acetylglucosamine transferase
LRAGIEAHEVTYPRAAAPQIMTAPPTSGDDEIRRLTMTTTRSATMTRTVMIVAGGTGGHVYPGLAVAEALRARDVELHWMGTERGIEARVVPLAGVPLVTTIPVSGLRRRGWWRWLAAPFGVSYAVWCALAAMRRIRPQVVLGMGGFVSGPGGIAAWLTRRPLIIHEQNAVPGLSNRILSHFARRVLQGFPNSFAPRACTPSPPATRCAPTSPRSPRPRARRHRRWRLEGAGIRRQPRRARTERARAAGARQLRNRQPSRAPPVRRR